MTRTYTLSLYLSGHSMVSSHNFQPSFLFGISVMTYLVLFCVYWHSATHVVRPPASGAVTPLSRPTHAFGLCISLLLLCAGRSKKVVFIMFCSSTCIIISIEYLAQDSQTCQVSYATYCFLYDDSLIIIFRGAELCIPQVFLRFDTESMHSIHKQILHSFHRTH